MKTKFTVLLLLVATALFGQETLTVYHPVGGVASSTILGEYIFSLNPSQGALNATTQFGDFSVARNDTTPLTDNTTGSGISLPMLAAVTGSTTAQDVNIPTTQYMNQSRVTYMLLDPEHIALQEVVAATVVDATHFHAKVFNNHALSASVRIIYSSFTKYLSVQHLFATASLTNINFIRANPLPANVYDQYRTLGSVGTLDYEPDNYSPWASGTVYFPTTPCPGPVPQYDPGSLSGTGNPTNAIVLAAGPITTSLTKYVNPQVQILFTSAPEPILYGIDYRVYWDH